IAELYAELGSPIGGTQVPDEWLKRLGALPLLYPPGERFHYSQATDVLGFLVARVEGKTFGEVLQERIFGPLGMVDTDFWCPPEKRDRMAKLYRLDLATDRLTDVSFPHIDRAQVFEGGGGCLVSTADDYLKFARMMLGKGEIDGVRLLKASTIEMMCENRLTEAQRQIPFMGLPFWMGQGFGLGVSVVLDPQAQAWMGPSSKGALSWPGAFGTWWRADPEEDMVAIYLIQNSMPLGPEAAAQIAASPRMGGRMALITFLNLVYGALGR
ncbi:serine hydrolase domain-containing protein, partial [Phenylobacterium sp.]|uniref:serine hydrolase domain-containing protein n=1 Tax=Phenylobacterium sp. TaxID=1871053 RepID=UPI0012072B9E